MKNEKIVRAAASFRRAMEETYNEFGVEFSQFPRACCGSFSSLLAAYLKDQGLGTFAYVSGFDERQSHGWLELGSLIVDGTYDQLGQGLDEVIVTTDDRYHSKYANNKETKLDGDFRIEDDLTCSRLQPIYERLCSQIRKSS